MPKVEIEVDQILTSAVYLEEINPGDKLLVMNGVVIGAVDKVSVRREEPPPPKSPKPALRGTGPSRHEIINVLRTAPATARDIGYKLGLDPAGRGRMSHVMRALRDAGVIEQTNDDRYPAYRLKNAPPAAEAAD